MKFYIHLFLFFNFFHLSFANSSCPFCDEEVLQNQVVFESEYLRVLVDYVPLVKGHLLVIPKRHVVKAHELSIKEWEELSIVIPKIVNIFKNFLNIEEYIFLEKNGRNAFQSIPHVHFHVLPIPPETYSKITQIFVKPPILTKEELEEEVNLFKTYFLEEEYIHIPLKQTEP